MEIPSEIKEAAEYVRDNDAWEVHDPYGYERQDVGNVWFEEQAKKLADFLLRLAEVPHQPD